MRRRSHGVTGLQVRHLERGRNQVVHQRHPDPIDDAAVHLTLDDHRVDPGTAVVDREEPTHLYHRGAGIDVDHTEVRAIWIREILRVVTDLGVQPTLDALGQVAGAVRAHRDVLDGDRRRWIALDVERPLLPLQIGDRGLKHSGRDDLRLVPDLARDQCRGRARHGRGPTAIGTETERGLVGVTVYDVYVIRRDPELLGNDLRKGRLMTLTLCLN